MKADRGPWLRHVLFTLTEHGAIRILDAATTLVLVRVMSTVHFGLYSVYQSWVSVLLLFLPALDQALYRDYSKLKAEGRLADELSAYRAFNLLKVGVGILLVLSCSLIVQPERWTLRLALLAFAFALPFSQAYYGFLREPLRFELKQHLVATIGALQRLVLLAVILLASWLRPDDLVSLSAASLVVYFVFARVWAVAAAEIIPSGVGRLKVARARQVIGNTLKTTVLWIHVIGVILASVQTLDTLSLNLFGVDLAEIGRYSIALKSANFFQAIPLALTNVIGVYLARESGKRGALAESGQLWRQLAGFGLLCAVLFLLGLVVAEPLIHFVAKGKLSDPGALERTLVYFKWQLAGLLVLCASYPLSTHLMARAPLRDYLTRVYLPWLVFAALAYPVAASHGPMVAARTNVAVYLLLWLLLLAFKGRQAAFIGVRKPK